MAANRIEQTTPATKETDERTRPATSAAEESVYWTPAKTVGLIAAISIGVLSSVGAVITAGVFTPSAFIGAAIAGITTGLATFFGIKSGGTPK